MSDQRATSDLVVAGIADRQHGVVSVDQLSEAGLDKHAVHHRVRTGRLHRIHRGVYAVGHSAIAVEAHWMAAVLACGGKSARIAGGREIHGDELSARWEGDGSQTILDRWGASLSHRSAASLWRLLPVADGVVDVSVRGGGGRRKRRGIRLRRSATLLPASVTLRRGIPVTTPARTVSDLRRAVSTRDRRGVISSKELRRAIRQADVLGLPLDAEIALDRTRSDLERDFLRLCRRHRLPPPEVNVRIGRHLVDFLWRDRRLVVETDGYRYHGGRAAFEDDRVRGLALRGRGYEVVRLADRQLTKEPEQIVEVLRDRLAP